MGPKIKKILKEALKKAEPPEEDFIRIKHTLKKFKEKINGQIKKQKLDAALFEGGSFAKKTLIKKDKYDLDIFIRFSGKYKGMDISKLAQNLLKGIKNVFVIHGSRDYFQIREFPDLFIELIPVMQVGKPGEAENVTDLSYLHVKYINKKIKSRKILDEIKIAKAFCHASKTYGAESYIGGFSGYSIELLIYHYKSFLNFIKAMIKQNANEKMIIDIEKHYKKKEDVLRDINSSKLASPVILIDPTYKQRNALSALSEGAFEKFKKAAKDFLKKPSMDYFNAKEIDFEKLKKEALKKNRDFVLVGLQTEKPEGNVAGSKLLKFYSHLEMEIAGFFVIEGKGFEYGGEHKATGFFSLKPKKEMLREGPFIKDRENLEIFRRKHKKTFYKSGRIYAKEKFSLSAAGFLKHWKEKYRKKLAEMDISRMEIS